LLGSTNRWLTYSTDYIDPEPNELRRKVSKTTIVPLRVSVFDDNVLALDPAVFAQPFAPRLNETWSWRYGHDANTVNFTRLLRLGGERRGDRSDTADDERAAVHHSIT
jgi:hypothetical protein